MFFVILSIFPYILHASPINLQATTGLLLSSTIPSYPFNLPSSAPSSIFKKSRDGSIDSIEKENLVSTANDLSIPFKWETGLSFIDDFDIDNHFDFFTNSIDPVTHLIPFLREWYKQHKEYLDRRCRVGGQDKTLLEFYLLSSSQEDSPGEYSWYKDIFEDDVWQEMRLLVTEIQVVEELSYLGDRLFHGGEGWIDAFAGLGDDEIDRIRDLASK
jgi:hypothetical protein